jgi:hypothetical protein
MNLEAIKAYAVEQMIISNRAGELAAKRLWQQMAELAQQLINMNKRIIEKKDDST